MHFWHPRVASLKKSRKFFAECPEMILKLPFLSTKIFHPKTSYWHVVCRVHNLAREILPDCSKKFDLVPKLMKNLSSTKYFTSKYSYGHLECNSDKPFSSVLTKSRIFFVHASKTTKKTIISREKIPWNVPQDTEKAVWTTQSKKNLTKCQKYFAQGPKLLKRNLFEKQMIPLKTFLWTRKLHFWQLCPSSLKKGRIVFAQCPKMIPRFFLWKNTSPQNFQRTFTRQLWRLYRKILEKSQKLFSQDPKIVNKHTSKENYFPIFSYRHIKNNFDYHAKNFLSEGCKSLNVQKWQENTFSKNKSSSKNVTVDT